MVYDVDRKFIVQSRTFARGCGIIAILIGSMLLLGWVFNIPPLSTQLPYWLSIKPNAALGLLLLGIALVLQIPMQHDIRPNRRLIAQVCAIIVMLIGLFTLIEFIVGIYFRLDRILVPWFTGDPSAVQLSLNTAAYFILQGLALAVIDVYIRHRWWLSQYLVVLAAFVVLVPILGYLYGLAILYGHGSYNPIALVIAIILLMLSIGTLFVRPEYGAMAAFVSKGPGGIIMRRLLPPIIVLTLLIGWGVSFAEHEGLFVAPMGVAVLVISVILLFTGLVTMLSGSLRVADLERQQAEEEIRHLNRELEQRVAKRTGELELANQALQGEIAERQRTEAALRQSEERFRLLVESVKDYAIFLLAPEGRIVSWNIGAERIKGYRPEEVIGKSFTLFYTPEDIADGKPQRELATALAEGRLEDEGWRVRKDGSRFWASVVITPIYDESGQLLGFAKITRDITERRRAEQELQRINEELQRRTVELEASNRELEAFSYSVSHDLRAPLRSIDGFSLALLEDYADKLDAHGRDYLQRVRAASQRMGQLIDDLLRLSRITRTQMRYEPVNLSALAQSILADLHERDPDRVVEEAITPEVIVKGDPDLLRIALDNLLGNAWKFTKKRPVAKIEFGTTLQDGETVYYIRDNGAGFDMAYAGKLFTPFQRLHAVEEFPGTGIGLAIVHRIIRRHGGRIWAESAVDQGTTIYFTLNSTGGTT